MPGDQRYQFQVQFSLFPQLHNGDAFVMGRLGEGILEGRPAVADSVGAHVLGAVDMAQRHIVKVRENGGIYVVRAAHGYRFRLAGCGTGDELVRKEHIACVLPQRHMLDGGGAGIRIAFDGFLREKLADMNRLQEGQQPEMYLSKGIRQGDWLEVPVVNLRNMDTAALHQAAAEGQPFRAVVVAADDQHRKAAFGQTVEKIIKKGDGLGRGNAFVIHIPGNQQGVRLHSIDDPENLGKNIFLVIQHGDFVDPLSKVQVGQVNEFHGKPPLFLLRERIIRLL